MNKKFKMPTDENITALAKKTVNMMNQKKADDIKLLESKVIELILKRFKVAISCRLLCCYSWIVVPITTLGRGEKIRNAKMQYCLSTLYELKMKFSEYSTGIQAAEAKIEILRGM